MADINELLQLFARSIFAKASALKASELTPNQRKQLRGSITAEIRACGRLLYPEVRAPEVSEAALQEATRLGVRICAQTWQTQSRFDRGRKTFHWEHVNPISCIQAACEEAGQSGTFLVLFSELKQEWRRSRDVAHIRRSWSAPTRVPNAF